MINLVAPVISLEKSDKYVTKIVAAHVTYYTDRMSETMSQVIDQLLVHAFIVREVLAL